MFLFQTGAIKSYLDADDYEQWLGFYSKLVRLKVMECVTCPVLEHVSFYSKLVRLKVQVLLVFPSRVVGFYSKLVRLKGYTSLMRNRLIKTVSIPNWCD